VQSVKSDVSPDNRLTADETSAIIALQNLIKATKKPSPQRISRFCGLITDILLADTYIIAVLVAFVNIKF
jgi:hypothetical protein